VCSEVLLSGGGCSEHTCFPKLRDCTNDEDPPSVRLLSAESGTATTFAYPEAEDVLAGCCRALRSARSNFVSFEKLKSPSSCLCSCIMEPLIAWVRRNGSRSCAPCPLAVLGSAAAHIGNSQPSRISTSRGGRNKHEIHAIVVSHSARPAKEATADAEGSTRRARNEQVQGQGACLPPSTVLGTQYYCSTTFICPVPRMHASWRCALTDRS
jgi:hypothetical protein